MLLDIIKAKLTSAGVIDGTTWRCFIGFAPDTQDQLISLHATGGYPQDTHAGDVNRETFQLRVRTGEMAYTDCETKWRAAFNALHDADLSASDIYQIQAESAGPLEYYDENGRVNMTVNFRVTRAKP